MQTLFIQWRGTEPTLIRNEINGAKVKVKPNQIIEVPEAIARDLSSTYAEIVIVNPQAEAEKEITNQKAPKTEGKLNEQKIKKA